MSRHRHMLIVVSTIWYTAVPSTSSVCTTIVSRHCGGDMGHDAGNTRHDAGDTGHDATIRDTARRYGTHRAGDTTVLCGIMCIVLKKSDWSASFHHPNPQCQRDWAAAVDDAMHGTLLPQRRARCFSCSGRSEHVAPHISEGGDGGRAGARGNEEESCTPVVVSPCREGVRGGVEPLLAHQRQAALRASTPTWDERVSEALALECRATRQEQAPARGHDGVGVGLACHGLGEGVGKRERDLGQARHWRPKTAQPQQHQHKDDERGQVVRPTRGRQFHQLALQLRDLWRCERARRPRILSHLRTVRDHVQQLVAHFMLFHGHGNHRGPQPQPQGTNRRVRGTAGASWSRSG